MKRPILMPTTTIPAFAVSECSSSPNRVRFISVAALVLLFGCTPSPSPLASQTNAITEPDSEPSTICKIPAQDLLSTYAARADTSVSLPEAKSLACGSSVAGKNVLFRFNRVFIPRELCQSQCNLINAGWIPESWWERSYFCEKSACPAEKPNGCQKSWKNVTNVRLLSACTCTLDRIDSNAYWIDATWEAASADVSCSACSADGNTCPPPSDPPPVKYVCCQTTTGLQWTTAGGCYVFGGTVVDRPEDQCKNPPPPGDMGIEQK